MNFETPPKSEDLEPKEEQKDFFNTMSNRESEVDGNLFVRNAIENNEAINDETFQKLKNLNNDTALLLIDNNQANKVMRFSQCFLKLDLNSIEQKLKQKGWEDDTITSYLGGLYFHNQLRNGIHALKKFLNRKN